MIAYILFGLFRGLVFFVLCYVVIMGGIKVLQMIFALFITSVNFPKNRNFGFSRLGVPGNQIPFSLLVPAFNEEETIVDSVKSMLNLDYTNYEIVIINDGSTDNTLASLINAFSLNKISYPVRERLATKRVKGIYCNPDLPRLRIIDKENGGKSDALNAGINLSFYPYIVSLSADSLLEADALFRIAIAFVQNKYTVAVGGAARACNGCTVVDGKIQSVGLPKNIWALFQAVEYLHSFLAGRVGWSSVNSLLIVSGAFGAFQKEAVLLAGGFSEGTPGEDMDMVIKLHRYMRSKKYRYRVSFMPDPVFWKMAPESLAVLNNQYRRWQVRLMNVLGSNRDMILNPRFGMLGMLVMPYYFLFEMLSPIIELSGYILIPIAWYFDLLSLDAMILFFAAAFLFGSVASAGSLIIEEITGTKNIKVKDVLVLGLMSIAENIFFRQLTALFRLTGFFTRK